MKISMIDHFSSDARDDSRALQYSLLKLGQKRSIETYARELAERIVETLPGVDVEPDKWVLAYPGTGHGAVPNAIAHVSGRVATCLGVPCVGLGKRDNTTTDYAAQSTADRIQNRSITLDSADQDKVKDKKVILVDDGIASGTAIAKSGELLAQYGELSTCFVLADFRAAGDPSYERFLNRFVVDLVGAEIYATLLNNEENYTTSKLIAYFFEDYGQLQAAINYLRPSALANLAFATLVYFRERATPYLTLLRDHLMGRRDDMDGAVLSRLIEVVNGLIVEAGDANKAFRLSTVLSRQDTFRLRMNSVDQAYDDIFAGAPAMADAVPT